MTMKPLYEQIVDVTTDYLGPAARRFIDRQIANHVHKQPEELELDDLPGLIDWVRVSIAFLTQDTKIIDELTKRLRNLQKTTRARG